MKLFIWASLIAGLPIVVGCGKTPAPAPGQRDALVWTVAPSAGPQKQLGLDQREAVRIQLERMGGRAGPVTLEVKSLNEGAPVGQESDWRGLFDAAGEAVDRSRTVAWLGNWDSDSTAVVLPRLNQVGVIAVSPGATATPFTTPDPEFPGAPDKYFPDQARFGRTFLRLVPSDLEIASAAVRALSSRSVRAIFTADAGDTDGISFSSAISTVARANGVKLVGHRSMNDPTSEAAKTIQDAISLGAQAICWGSPVGMGAEDVWRAAASNGRLAMVAGPALFGPQAAKLNVVARGTTLFAGIVPARVRGRRAEDEERSFERKARRRLEPGAMNAAAALQVIAAVISLAAKTDGPKTSGGDLRSLTADSLHRIGPVETVIGKIAFDRSGNPLGLPTGEWRLLAGKFVFEGAR